MRVVMLFNPIAGAGRSAQAARELSHPLRRGGYEVVLSPTSPGAPEAALRDQTAGATALVVCGGDGAVRLAAPIAIETGVPVYHVPSGTENLFAREFGMTRRAESLLAALAAVQIRRVDIGVVNDRLFLLMASVGFDAEVVHDLASRRGRHISHFSYVPSILRRYVRWQPPRLAVTVDGRRLDEDRRGFVVVANSPQYGARLNPGRDASMTDGRLDVVFFPTRSRRELIGWAWRCRRQRHVDDPRLVYERGETIEIVSGSGPVRYQIDGDPPDPARRGDHLESAAGGLVTSLQISIRPEALPVLLPAATS
jgi:diacylglycerol kinase family enzyme